MREDVESDFLPSQLAEDDLVELSTSVGDVVRPGWRGLTNIIIQVNGVEKARHEVTIPSGSLCDRYRGPCFHQATLPIYKNRIIYIYIYIYI